jgi:hypothetical protein
MAMYHNGTDSFITNDTGDLKIRQFANDKDIIFDCDDGSGSVETYFLLDGSASSGYPRTIFPDDSTLNFGDSMDLRITHMAGASYIINTTTTDLYLRQDGADKDIIFQSDDGSGGEETYFYLDGSVSSGNPVTKFPDNSILALGTGGDFYHYHDGTNSYHANFTGHFYIDNNANDKDVILRSDDGSGGVTAYLTCDGSTETVVIDRGVTVAQRTVSGDVTVASSDYIVAFGSCSSAPTVTLPDAQRAAGRMLVFKEIDGYYNITIDPEGSTTIDGSATYTSSGTRPVIRVFSDGTNWFIM